MDKDRIAGAVKKIKGSIKETVGKVTGDAKLEAEGKADKVEGKVQRSTGSTPAPSLCWRAALWRVRPIMSTGCGRCSATALPVFAQRSARTPHAAMSLPRPTQRARPAPI